MLQRTKKTIAAKRVTRSIWFPRDMDKELKRAASAAGRSVIGQVQHLCRQGLKGKS